MRYLLFSFAFILTSNHMLAQTGLVYNVKIKPGNAIKTLPDNKHTAITSGKDILLVDNSTGQVIVSFEGHSGNVTDLDTNEDGSLLVSSSMDNTLIVWDVNARTKLVTLIGHEKSVTHGKFISSSKIASASNDNSMKVWDVETGKIINSYVDHSKKLKSLAVSTTSIATGGSDNKITIRNVEDGEVRNQFVAADAAISALAFDGKGEKLIAGSDDGTVKVWEIANGKLLKERSGKGKINNIQIANDNLHILVAGSSCTIYSLPNLDIRKEIDQVSSMVLDASFTPDGANLFFLEEFVSSARYWNISELNIAHVVRLTNDADKTAPQIYLSSPAKIIDNRVVHYEDLLKIQGSVIDDYGVQNLKVNGIVTPIAQNGSFVINLPLSIGDNFVTIEANDVNNNTSVKKFIVSKKNMDGEIAYDATEAKNYLLVIGINEYSHWPRLFNAVKDANDVVNTLLSLYNFEYNEVKLITNEQATRSNIYKTLRSYVNLVGPQDNFMIYYSGHGYFDGVLNEGYWVPVDARLNNNGDYLSNSDISKIIASINSQHTFLVADACFSGSLFNEQTRGYAENVEKYKSRWGLASGRLETVSDGQAGNNSPFTQNFVKYLKENKKEKVAVSELVQFVKIQVSEVSDQTPIGNPLKGVGDEGGEFIFYKKKY
ncbi:MAG: caspase family protein [Cyclobacteriaceae bacterium]